MAHATSEHVFILVRRLSKLRALADDCAMVEIINDARNGCPHSREAMRELIVEFKNWRRQLPVALDAFSQELCARVASASAAHSPARADDGRPNASRSCDRDTRSGPDFTFPIIEAHRPIGAVAVGQPHRRRRLKKRFAISRPRGYGRAICPISQT
jgi:hypothetical protein